MASIRIAVMAAVTLAAAASHVHGKKPRLLYSVPDCTLPQWSASADLLACYHSGRDRHGTVIYDGKGKEQNFLTGIARFAWSPDGKSGVGAVEGKRLALFKQDGALVRGLPHEKWVTVDGVSWKSDGTELAFRGWANYKDPPGCYSLKLSADKLAAHPGCTTAVWSKASKGRVAMVTAAPTVGKRVLMIRDSLGGKPTTVQILEDCVPNQPQWSPDGKWLAFYCGTKTAEKVSSWIQVADTSTASPIGKRLIEDSGEGFAWAPDSSEIATSLVIGKPGKPMAIAKMKLVGVNIQRSSTRDLVTPRKRNCRIWQPAWSSTGLAVLHQCEPPEPTKLEVYKVP